MLKQLTKRGDFISPFIFPAFPPLNVWNTSPYTGLHINGDASLSCVVGYLADFKLRESSMNPERSERIEIPVLPLRDVVVYPHMV
ncbi:MAG: hypothetical protein E7C19_25730, partial [Klebsiella oxytoca]|nr:hypothetical protein [Klebsiella michiganensis]MDU2775672.1 hypothetical protein [Klebsiella grimontii]MDU2799965.1 hypothetical protein [Klebsiella oxytoca]MDU3022289.1 hypothetical protein [Klebsiella oxytoca]MDU7359439.1 hypothetical protein [Klebsiella oxytoca]